MIPLPPKSTLFPYTTLFRSGWIEETIRMPRIPFGNRPGFTDLFHVCNFCRIQISTGSWVQHGMSRARILATKFKKKELVRSEEHTSELQSLTNLVCRLLLEK